MQDRTPQIVAAGDRKATYTGNYPSLLLRTIRKAGPKGATVERLLASLGLLSDKDQEVSEFRAALGELVELELIGCPEFESLDDHCKVLELHFVWRIK